MISYTVVSVCVYLAGVCRRWSWQQMRQKLVSSRIGGGRCNWASVTTGNSTVLIFFMEELDMKCSTFSSLKWFTPNSPNLG